MFGGRNCVATQSDARKAFLMSSDFVASKQFRRDVLAGLSAVPKTLPPKYFYDALGSRIFDAICELPWYAVTRAEHRLLRRHTRALANIRPTTVIELGPGNGEKVSTVATATASQLRRVHLIDVSRTSLETASAAISQVSSASVFTHRTTFEQGLRATLSRRANSGPALLMLLGSTIGNYEPSDRAKLFEQIRRHLRPNDRLLLGADLAKPAQILRVAYDDPLGVTAAFNKNVLVRINTELGGNFDLTRFKHKTLWNARQSRVEMHLVSREAQRVSLRGLRTAIHFNRGESIWTESSYKFSPRQLAELGTAVGLRLFAQWIDRRDRFALTLYGRA